MEPSNEFVTNLQPSNTTVRAANKHTMRATDEGDMQVMVLNTANYHGIAEATPLQLAGDMGVTVVPNIHHELLSFDSFYRSGQWNLHLRQPDYECGVSELIRPAWKGHTEEIRIPLWYNYEDETGGFWMHYVPIDATNRMQSMRILHCSKAIRRMHTKPHHSKHGKPVINTAGR